MQFKTSKKTVKDISHSMIGTEEIGSDEYMRARGFVEVSPDEASRYDSIFDCANGASMSHKGFLYEVVSHCRLLFGRAT